MYVPSKRENRLALVQNILHSDKMQHQKIKNLLHETSKITLNFATRSWMEKDDA